MASTKLSFVCANCARTLRSTKSRPVGAAPASLSSSSKTSFRQTLDPVKPEDEQELPRWARTPPAMRMPIRVRSEPRQPAWKVNDNPEILDEVLDRFIGKAGGAGIMGRDLLPEEVKWLAVTHKSFDHGRRGFNDRLAFLGKRILELQVSKALLGRPSGSAPDPQAMLQQSQIHRALHGLDNLTSGAKDDILSPARLANLASTYGLERVTRWKPRLTTNLRFSGIDAVMATTIYAIVGAVSLQKGGEVAARLAKESVLKPLGLR